MSPTASSDLNDEEYWPSTFIAIVPRVTSTLSILSYSVILFLIFRSAAKASTIYHRLMVEISIAGILLALSTGLGTWPMPVIEPDWVVKDIVGGSWPGPRYGNEGTCDAQGFVNQFGDRCILTCITMICVYYAFSIGFRLKERNIRRYVQPVLLSLPLALGLGEAIFSLVNEEVNFAPNGNRNMAYGAGPWCKHNRAVKSSGRKKDHYQKVLHITGFVLVVGSLSVVLIWTFFARRHLEENLNEVDDISERHDDEKVDRNESLPSAFESRGSISVDLSGAISSKGIISFKSVLKGNASDHEVIDSGKKDITGKENYMYYSSPSEIFMEELFYGRTSTSIVASDEKDNSCNLAEDTNENSNPKIVLNPAVLHEESYSEKSESMNPKSIRGTSELPESIDPLEAKLEKVVISHRLSLQAAEREVKFGVISLLLQSFAYIILFLTSELVGWIVFYMKGESKVRYGAGKGFYETTYKVDIILKTLHGVFNMLVFLMHKVYNIRRIDKEKSVFDILLFLFRTRHVQEPCFVSRISLVKQEVVARDLYAQLLVSDEKGDRIIQIGQIGVSVPSDVDNIEAGKEMYVEGGGSIHERDHDLSFAPDSKNLEGFSDDGRLSFEVESMPG